MLLLLTRRPYVTQQLPSEQNRDNQTNDYPSKVAENFDQSLHTITQDLTNHYVQHYPQYFSYYIPTQKFRPRVTSYAASKI